MVSRLFFVLLLGVGLVAPVSAYAQTESAQAPATTSDAPRSDREWKTAKFSAAFYPFAMVGSHFKVGLTYSLNDAMALHAVGSYMFTEDRNGFYNYFNIGGENSNYTGYNVELHLRYFALGRAQNGLYLGPYAWYRGLTASGELNFYDPRTGTVVRQSNEEKVGAVGVGIVTGFQALVGRVVFDVYIGGGPNFPSGAFQSMSGNNFMFSFRRGMAYNGGLSIGVVLGK